MQFRSSALRLMMSQGDLLKCSEPYRENHGAWKWVKKRLLTSINFSYLKNNLFSDIFSHTLYTIDKKIFGRSEFWCCRIVWKKVFLFDSITGVICCWHNNHLWTCEFFKVHQFLIYRALMQFSLEWEYRKLILIISD